MSSREIIYRQLFENNNTTQLSLAREVGLSLGSVNSALRPLFEMGCLQRLKRGFRVIDREKLLMFWASVYSFSKKVVYSTSVNTGLRRIESGMPAGAIFTAFSGFKFLYKNVPADYGEVYVYADEETLGEIKTRFPVNSGRPNLIVLKADKPLIKLSAKQIAPVSQIFVDLWNLGDWYARDFVNELRRRLF